MQINEPYILLERLALPLEPEPSSEHRYDYVKQIWINEITGKPVIAESNLHQSSKFGETSVTETREGVDQAEVISLQASQFGETSLTKTTEGHDQGESVFASGFFLKP